MISLLMKESDDLGTTTLRPTQVAILLRLFAASVRFLYERVVGGTNTAVAVGTNASAKKAGSNSATKAAIRANADSDSVASWDSLTDHIQRDFPRLLTRFRDDKDNLLVLTQLLPFYDPSAMASNGKSFKQCLKCVSDICFTNPGEDIVSYICVALKSWLSASRSSQVIHDLVSQTIQDMLSQLQSRINDSVTESTELLKTVSVSDSSDSSQGSNIGIGQSKSAGSKSKSKPKQKGQQPNVDTQEQV